MASGDLSARYSLVLVLEPHDQIPISFAATGTDVELTEGDPIEVWLTKTAGGTAQVQLLRNLRTGRTLVDRVNYGAGRFTWALVVGAAVLVILITIAVRRLLM